MDEELNERATGCRELEECVEGGRGTSCARGGVVDDLLLRRTKVYRLAIGSPVLWCAGSLGGRRSRSARGSGVRVGTRARAATAIPLPGARRLPAGSIGRCFH